MNTKDIIPFGRRLHDDNDDKAQGWKYPWSKSKQSTLEKGEAMWAFSKLIRIGTCHVDFKLKSADALIALRMLLEDSSKYGGDCIYPDSHLGLSIKSFSLPLISAILATPTPITNTEKRMDCALITCTLGLMYDRLEKLKSDWKNKNKNEDEDDNEMSQCDCKTMCPKLISKQNLINRICECICDSMFTATIGAPCAVNYVNEMLNGLVKLVGFDWTELHYSLATSGAMLAWYAEYYGGIKFGDNFQENVCGDMDPALFPKACGARRDACIYHDVYIGWLTNTDTDSGGAALPADVARYLLETVAGENLIKSSCLTMTI